MVGREITFGSPGTLVTVLNGQLIAVQFNPDELASCKPGDRVEAEVLVVKPVFAR